MKGQIIHELINLKARRLELEIELGISNVKESHLSKKQKAHIKHDQKHHQATFKDLNNLNHIIESDEQIIGEKY